MPNDNFVCFLESSFELDKGFKRMRGKQENISIH